MLQKRKQLAHPAIHTLPEKQGMGAKLYDIILGGQDGVVNVLGIVLGVATATNDTRIVLISGLASTFAESLSMGAVAYTSAKAARDYYYSELQREEREIETMPAAERKEIRDIYANKGFKGIMLEKIVKHITSNKKRWVETMMAEELRMSPENHAHPFRESLLVGFASLIGSLIPITPFFFAPVKQGIYVAVAFSVAVLFVTGAIKAKITVGKWWLSGIEMSLIGMTAALAGYGIGLLLGVAPL